VSLLASGSREKSEGESVLGKGDVVTWRGYIELVWVHAWFEAEAVQASRLSVGLTADFVVANTSQ